MKFSHETITPALLDEVRPLLEEHWAEITSYPDIPLDPDYEIYLKMQEIDAIKSFSARDGNGVLLGYSVYFIRKNHHYRNTLYAVSDIIFITKDKRGFGGLFINYCDQELKEMGVIVCQYHIKAKFDWGKGLERMGYDLQDKIYAKRLN